MITSILKRTIFISLLGHLTVFNIFSFSFGNRITKPNYANVYFWGAFLRKADFMIDSNLNAPNIKNIFFIDRPNALSTQGLNSHLTTLPTFGRLPLKPTVILTSNVDKMSFGENILTKLYIPQKKESVIEFYPILPEHFRLYFKDRQVVHIELMFNIIPTEKTNSITIKRKVSSGNLDADLVTMRYISHYLFIQQSRFRPDNWQIVKIDLSAKE